MATTENESPATDEELDTIVTGLVQLDTPASTVKQDSKQLEQGGDAIINWRRALSDVTRIREALDEEKRVRRRAKRELREKEKDLINDLQVIIRDEQQERTRMEEELRESQRMLKELQTILAEERQENTRVDEELSQAKVALADKERFVKEIQRKLEEEQQSRIVVNEELRQATIDKNELEKRLQNDIVQVRRTLDNEVNLRSTKEQELRNKERIVNTLQRTLEEEQQARTRMAQELSQAKERLQSQLAQMRKTLDDRERIVEELQNALEEDQQARTAVDEELSQARSLCDDLEERLEDERLQSHSRQQHLQTKENVIREQRRRLEEEQQQRTALEERVRNLEQERNRHLSIVRQLQSAVSAAEEAVSESRDWIIQREEVVLSRKMLGKGAWGNVFEGTFRGCQVAVKEIHELILSDHNRRLFEREMSIASRCRHPNLLQFIGATNNEGSPLFVTELLDTSLRHVLSQRALNHEETVSLALDIAKGLNYLHLHKPSPIIHRDISSANVLLWRRDESWRAKLSDYGAANFMRQLMTVNPGAPIYCAPEALTTQQSPKVNIFRCLNQIVDFDFNFKHTTVIHSYNTRERDNPQHPPTPKTNWGKQKLPYQAASDFNNLSLEIKETK